MKLSIARFHGQVHFRCRITPVAIAEQASRPPNRAQRGRTASRELDNLWGRRDARPAIASVPMRQR
jgi:hypothetical protein